MLNIAEGAVIADKYRVERVLGAGGMGVVVVAMHLHLEERVAIKFLLPEVAMNGEAVARFTREARVAAKIKSEHVARVLDVATLADGTPYLVMEYLIGSDLTGYLRDRGPLDGAEAASFMLQACEALAEAHALGIVHRDLKPANLFLAQRPDGSKTIKILDFGISKISGGAGSGQMTRTTAIMGSPNYMSPEQLKSARDVDARSDIWSLGVTLFELLTGRVPYEADDLPQLCTMILYSEPRGLRDFRQDLPGEWQRVIQRALAKERDQRYANVAEFARDVSAFTNDGAVQSVERISRLLGAPLVATEPRVSRPTGPGPVTSASWGQTQPPGSGRRGAVWAVAALGLLTLMGAVAAGGWFVLSKRAASAEAPSALEPTAPPPPVATAVMVVPPSPAVTETAAPPPTNSASAQPPASASSAPKVAAAAPLVTRRQAAPAKATRAASPPPPVAVAPAPPPPATRKPASRLPEGMD